MRNRLLFLVLSLFVSGSISAQIVGTNCFLQGRFTEAGVNQMGGLGTCTSLTTLHVHACCGLAPGFSGSASTAMDASYDWGHDGWSTGVNPLVGPYTIPGYPQEGWSVQVGATEYRNGAWGGVCTGAFAIPGGHTGYTNVGSKAIEYWEGNIAGLNIKQQTRVDTMASWITVTATLRNTTGASIAGVWYERTCDPDNTTFWSGTPTTRNIIAHQNEDLRHLVHVVAHGQTGASGATPAYNHYNTYLALVTKDCRAKCGVIPGLSPSNTPATLWAGTGAVLYNLNDSNYADEGIYLVFNVGTIAAGDSAVVSYAYLYEYKDNHTGIDSALPDPNISVNNDTMAATPMLSPQFDTFDACANPLLTTIPVDLLYSDDKSWTLASWTWSPGTGLAATTGVHNTITLGALPPVITYTITGTCGPSCMSKTFYLTITSCKNAVSNAPCVGDTLRLNAPGDSTGATYKWYGPAPSTAVFSTSQAYFRFPAAMTDTGTYTVVKTVGSNSDTATTYVRVYALPVLSLSSNIPPCAPMANPLTLTCTPDSVCTSFAWTGPGGFTSTMQNPSVIFDSSKAGVYMVTAVSNHGCRNSNSIQIKPGVVADFAFEKHPGCPGDTVIITSNSSSNANVYSWAYGDGGTAAVRNPPPHIYTGGHNIYSVTLTVSNPYCSGSKTLEVDMKHNVTADFNFAKDTICNGAAVVINDLSTATITKLNTPVTPLFSHAWDYGDGKHTDATNGSPADYTYGQEGPYPVTLTVIDSLGCSSTKTKYVHVLQAYIRGIGDTTFCLTQPLALYNTEYVLPNYQPAYGYSYSWSPAANLSSSTVQVPMFSAIGQYVYTLTATYAPGHFDCPAYYVYKLNSILPRQLQHVTRDTKIMYGNSVQLYADSETYYMWTPNDGSVNNPDINNPIATPTVTTTYTLYGIDFYGCRDTALVKVEVDSSMAEFIPSAFTPNGDGLNDVFRLRGSRFHRMVEFRVYNRWGQQVFYTTTVEKGWDGTVNGVPADMGVYHYSVIVARPGYADNQVYKGDVTLIR